MEKKWKAGDKVRLATGGPEMTVKSQHFAGEFSSDEVVECQWFNDRGELKEGQFPPESLVAL
jgi:uncharacterized protein YodC (DUF2158 family)